MEDAAMRAYALDISRSGDLTCQALNSEANIVDSTNDNVISTTSSVPGPAALPRRAIDPLLPPIDILEEEERMKRERMKQKNISANSPYSVAPSTVEGSMWCEAKSEEGYPYYWNVKTGDTIWEAPKEGYMTLEEYNRINKIAVAKQEQELKNESLFMQKNADEIAAKFQREQMKRLRPITTIKTEGEGNDATIENENFDEPGWSAKPLGQWQTVVKKEEKKIDLQLPKVNHNFVYVPTSVTDAPPIKKFKEKTVTTLDYGETAFTSGSFKKRRLPGKNNTRQRTDDD